MIAACAQIEQARRAARRPYGRQEALGFLSTGALTGGSPLPPGGRLRALLWTALVMGVLALLAVTEALRGRA